MLSLLLTLINVGIFWNPKEKALARNLWQSLISPSLPNFAIRLTKFSKLRFQFR